MTFLVDFGAAQTSIGYRFFDVTGAFVGSRVTSGISAGPQTGVYTATDTPGAGAIGIYWDCADANFVATAPIEDDIQINALPTAAAITTAVWAAGTRSLTTFGTLVADTATAVWGATVRTLSAFGFTVNTNANATETAIKAKTDNLPASPAATGDAMTLTGAYDAAKTAAQPGDIPSVASISEALLKYDWTVITGEADFSLLQAGRFLRDVWNTTDTPGHLTVYKEDGTTVAWTRTLASDPGAEPITGVS